MLCGTVTVDNRRFLYRIEGLESTQSHASIGVCVSDFKHARWKSAFTVRQLVRSFGDIDVEPIWEALQQTIRDAVLNDRFGIDLSTGVLHCQFEIVKGAMSTLRLPPNEKLNVRGGPESEIDVELAFGLYRELKQLGSPHKPTEISESQKPKPGEKRSVEEDVQQTPVKQQRSIGEAVVVHSLSKSNKRKQRNRTLRSK